MSLENFITDMLNIKLEDLENISPIKQSDGTIIVKLKLKSKPFNCPYCGQLTRNHGYSRRKLTHSTLINRKCYIIYLQRRYKCTECEKTFSEHNPFINTGESLTYETKLNVLQDLKRPESTYTAVAHRYNLTVTTVQRIFDKHVNIPPKPLPRLLSIDEHYFPESDYDSLYCCLLMDFATTVIIDILPDRRKNALAHYFTLIKNRTFNIATQKSELDNVQFISIDLHKPYKEIAQSFFPNATICADSFHVLETLTKCFRQIRLRCRRSTEDENISYLIQKFRYVFNHKVNLDNAPKYNKRLKRYINNREIRDLLFSRFPDLKKAYELKEDYILFNEKATYNDAEAGLIREINAFADANIPEYTEFYTLMCNWYWEIVNSFIIVQNKRINNSIIESRNRQVERLIYNANGFRNFKRARNRILYVLNKKDTYTI